MVQIRIKMKEFIDKNREAFDVHEPRENLWDQIDRRLDTRKKRIVLRTWLTRAAAILLLVAAGFGLSEYKHHVSVSKMADKTPELPAELRETQLYYETRVSARMNEMKPIFAAYPEVKEEINRDFSQLDSICVQLKADLKDNVSNQQVIEAMIQNYRTKLMILEDLLNELKQKNAVHEKKQI